MSDTSSEPTALEALAARLRDLGSGFDIDTSAEHGLEWSTVDPTAWAEAYLTLVDEWPGMAGDERVLAAVIAVVMDVGRRNPVSGDAVAPVPSTAPFDLPAPPVEPGPEPEPDGEP